MREEQINDKNEIIKMKDKLMNELYEKIELLKEKLANITSNSVAKVTIENCQSSQHEVGG